MRNMYGDFINGLCYTICLFIYLKMWWFEDRMKLAARNIVYVFLWTCVFSWTSYLKSNTLASILACLGMCLSIAGINLYQWPHSDEAVVVPQFFWTLLIISGNLHLHHYVKIVLGLVSLINSIVIGYFHPLAELENMLPSFLGGIVFFILFHHYCASSAAKQKKGVTAQTAILILGGIYTYNITSEILQMYSFQGSALDRGYAVLKTGFLASVGLAAAGAFQNEVGVNDVLEETVKQHSERLRIVEHALNACDMGFAIIDSHHRMVWFNPALEKLTGMPAKRLQMCHIMEVLNSSDTTNTNTECSQTLNKCFGLDCIQRDIMLKGRFIRVEITPLAKGVQWDDSVNDKSQHDSSGIIAKNTTRSKIAIEKHDHMQMIILRDMTAQKLAEKAQLEAEKAAVASTAKTEMIQTLSHELRTPLQGIMGVASTILADRRPENATICDSVSAIIASSRLLLTLINNVLDLRKLDSVISENEIELSEVPLASCIMDSIRFCEPFAVLNEVSLNFVPGCDDLRGGGESSAYTTVMANRLRLQQVMVNLISNAIKYTDINTQVKLSTRRCNVRSALDEARNAASSDLKDLSEEELVELKRLEGEAIVVSIRDHGAGIPPDEFGKVFGEFMQLKNSTKKVRQYQGGSAFNAGQSIGSGLGLNLAMKFVRMMNGHIWFNNCNSGGCGAEFCFFLHAGKLAIDSHVENDTSSAHEQQLLRPLLPGVAGELRVLVVDDSRINLKVLSRILYKVGIKDVQCASGGEQALQYIKSCGLFEPHIILTDIQMPEMDGFSLFTHLREIPWTSNPPIVVACTADWTTETEEQCTELGFDGIMRKPILFSDLQSLIARLTTGLSVVG